MVEFAVCNTYTKPMEQKDQSQQYFWLQGCLLAETEAQMESTNKNKRQEGNSWAF